MCGILFKYIGRKEEMYMWRGWGVLYTFYLLNAIIHGEIK